ncbi:STAS domain-containing protein [Streptomyces globisporus]|uniref:STAS domain-containing protein n=1 Tax=Streptomyces TaxID=1883 RepID=UPI00363F8A93
MRHRCRTRRTGPRPGPHRERPPRLVADLSGVTFCDSSGLGALVGIWRYAMDADASLTLAAIRRGLGAGILAVRQGNRTTA